MHKGDKDKDKDMGKDKKAGCLACKGNKKEKRRDVHFDFVSSPTGALYIMIITLQGTSSHQVFTTHSIKSTLVAFLFSVH